MTEESFNLPEWNEAVGQMIAHLDDADFPRILINAIRGLVPIDKSLISREKNNKSLFMCSIAVLTLKNVNFMLSDISPEHTCSTRFIKPFSGESSRDSII